MHVVGGGGGPHFFVEWNVKVNEARALATKGGGGGVAPPAKSQTENWAQRPLIHCVASPVEADDQLAYIVRCGLIHLIIQVDERVAGPCTSRWRARCEDAR